MMMLKHHIMLKRILQLWDQAGERPCEVLKEEGLYDDFMKIIDSY